MLSLFRLALSKIMLENLLTNPMRTSSDSIDIISQKIMNVYSFFMQNSVNI